MCPQYILYISIIKKNPIWLFKIKVNLLKKENNEKITLAGKGLLNSNVKMRAFYTN